MQSDREELRGVWSLEAEREKLKGSRATESRRRVGARVPTTRALIARGRKGEDRRKADERKGVVRREERPHGDESQDGRDDQGSITVLGSHAFIRALASCHERCRACSTDNSAHHRKEGGQRKHRQLDHASIRFDFSLYTELCWAMLSWGLAPSPQVYVQAYHCCRAKTMSA